MKTTKQCRCFLIVLFCMILMLSCVLPAAAAPSDTSSELTVGVPADRCPIFYLDPDTGEIVGIGVDLMKTAAETAGYSVSFRVIEEKNLKDALDNPAYDVILPFGSAITSASGRMSVVSDNLMQTPFTLVTEGNRKLPDLNDLHVGMLRSLQGATETVRQLYPGIRIDLYETMEECVDALRSEEVDALLHNSYVWSYVMQKPSYGDLRVQPSAMFSMDFRAGALDTPKGRETISRLNRGITALTDTRRQAVILDYTSRRLYQYDFSDYVYQYGLPVLLAALLFAALAVIASQRIHVIRKEHENWMRRLIDQDRLTGVLSAQGFQKRVEELLRDNPGIPYLLAYTNIKNFKFINDSLGRAAGDELLKFLADRTMETLSDKEAMGRLESDHFAILRRAEGDERVMQDDRQVIDRVRSYFTDKGKEMRIQVCGGVYMLMPEDYRKADVNHMLDLARAAEKKVRETSRDGYQFYNPEQWEKGLRTAAMISHLPSAIRSGEIQVWYQPQVNYKTGQITGAEALCRWQHASLGWISPGEFIPALEDAGLIHELDYFVWDKVCQDLQRWNQQGLHRSVSVNLSRCDIREDHDIAVHFHDLLQKYSLAPDQLRVEITETVYVENPAILISTTERLRSYGLQVEMDDFGSGYSSLHMLKEVPVDRIKLDLHFLTKSGNPEKSRTIITYMVQMVHSLGMELIAEGVETADQAEFLRDKGCSDMQGYYFCKPMPVQDLEKLYSQKDTSPKNE